jgi:hypothetical protein
MIAAPKLKPQKTDMFPPVLWLTESSQSKSTICKIRHTSLQTYSLRTEDRKILHWLQNLNNEL